MSVIIFLLNALHVKTLKWCAERSDKRDVTRFDKHIS